MGKAIVYCQICGRSLYEDDFDRGKASRLQNRPYCAECRPEGLPAPVPPAPPPRRTSSDRIPVFRPPPGDRPPSTTRLKKIPVRRRSSPALLWGSLLFIAIAAGVGLTVAVAGKAPASSADAPVVVEPPPLPPRPKPEVVDPAARDAAELRRLLGAPPADWKREEIDVLLSRRPELDGLRKDYQRGLRGLRLLEGLVGHWPLDEKDGTVARDLSGRGNDGKVLGAPLRVAGRIGGAFRCRGNGEDGVEIPSVNELDLTLAKSFTLSAWFLPDQAPPGKTDPANDAWYAVFIRPGMHMGLCYGRDGRGEMTYWLDGPKQATPKSEPIAPGAWTHLAGVVDVNAGRTALFVNGRPAGESAWPARSKAHFVRSPWRIGIAGPNAEEWSWSLKGAVDDVRFHARALDAEEIALLAEGTPLPAVAAAGRAPSNDGLVLHLRADAGVGLEGDLVTTWADVERKIVVRAEGDERPSLKAGAIVLDGRNDRLAFPAAPEHAFQVGDSFTLQAKVRVDAVVKGRYAAVFAKSLDQTPWYGIWTDPEGRWIFGSPLNLHGSPVKAGVQTVTAVQAGGQERRLYVDGVRVATGPTYDASGAGDLWIGGAKGRGEYFPGALLEIKLWRRALDPSELLIK
jgi:hypothetical protein